MRGRPTVITPEVRAECVRLNGLGYSLRKIAAEFTAQGVALSHLTVRTALLQEQDKSKAAALKGMRGRAAGGNQAGTGVDPDEEQDAEHHGRGDRGTDGVDQELLEPLPALPADADIAIQNHYTMMMETRRRIRLLPRDAKHATDYAALARVAHNETKQLKAMLPKPAPDPLSDPANLAAKELIHSQTRSVVEAVKERARGLGFRFPGDDR